MERGNFDYDYLIGVHYQENPSAIQVSMAEGYTLKYRYQDDKYYCLLANESLEERLEKLKHHSFKPEIVRGKS